MPTDDEMIDLIKGAAQEGQFDKMSIEEMESIYNNGSKLVKDRPYDEELIKAVNRFKIEIEKSKSNKSHQLSIRTPVNIFLFCIITVLLIPFFARLLSVPMYGWDWLAYYAAGIGGIIFISAMNMIPAIILYGVGRGSKRAPMAFWFATSALIGFLLWTHGTLNLRSSSTAPIALAIIPIYSVGVILVGWGIGLLMHFLVRAERVRLWLVGVVGCVAILFGAGLAINDAVTISKRESTFPVITVKQLPLVKRTVYSNKKMCEVEVLSFADFSTEAVNEIGVLGNSSITLLQPDTYGIKSESAFKQEDCERCVHMYPYIVPDNKGGILVASSDGLSDSQGHLLWKLKASSFTRLMPIRVPKHNPTFFSYQLMERIDRHNIDGNVMWSVNLNVTNIGVYITPDGIELPFAISECEKKPSELKIYNLDGKIDKTIILPPWAFQVSAIAWPERGNLVAGRGDVIGVIDSQGKEIFRHVIKNTSFNPYHGPDGVGIRFDSTQAPYLAVMSHGSSGYPRSVLLIFDPKGKLVWQEELNKINSIIVVPIDNGKREALLVGGMDGVIEYKFKDI